jgi:predicted nucleic acid-binding protein
VKVVADTSPLCYLLLIDQIDLLPELYGRVLIPEAVAAELAHTGAARRLQEWIARPPSWLEIREAPPPSAELSRLDAGEREAIALAEGIAADLVILDERKARQIALERGLSVTGLLGILTVAAERDLVGLPEIINRLRQTSFRANPKLLALLLDLDKAGGRGGA